MPYEFTPDDRFQHIAWVLDQLQDRYHDSDSALKEGWAEAIETHLSILAEMTHALIPKAAPESAKEG